VTVTTGTKVDTSTFEFAATLYSDNITVTVDGTLLAMNAAGEDTAIYTGSGADTVTFTGDATTVGGTAGDGGSIIINTGAGADTISMTHGTLTSQNTSQFASIDAGPGADTITKGTLCVNGTTTHARTIFNIDDGDSPTTGYDTITGYDLVENTGSLFGDILDFDTANVSSFTANADTSGIASHSISNGVVSFDDAGTYAAALKITPSNLVSALAYLAANMTTAGDTIAFLYDSNSDGTNDATFVFNQGTVDSLVLLSGTVAAGMSATTTITTDEYVIIN